MGDSSEVAGTSPSTLPGWLPVAARLVLAIVFIYASIDKIRHPAAFAQALYNYQILPGALINLVALVLPWLELLIGFLLATGIWMPGAVLLSASLLLVFMASMGLNLARGLNVACGCFTTNASEGLTFWTILRDAGFLLPALYLFWATFFKGSNTAFLR
jgi:hypothetical protein